MGTRERYLKHRTEQLKRQKEAREKETPEERETRLQYLKEWRKNNLSYDTVNFNRAPKEKWIVKALYRAKVRSELFNLPFSSDCLTLEDLPDTCPALGTPIQYLRGKGISSDSPSLDRIDNSKGYVKGNVRVLSHRANTIKSNAEPEELLAIVEYMLGALREN